MYNNSFALREFRFCWLCFDDTLFGFFEVSLASSSFRFWINERKKNILDLISNLKCLAKVNDMYLQLNMVQVQVPLDDACALLSWNVLASNDRRWNIWHSANNRTEQNRSYLNPHFDLTIRPIWFLNRHRSEIEWKILNEIDCLGIFASTAFCYSLKSMRIIYGVPDPSPVCDFLFAICAANVYHRNALFVAVVVYPFSIHKNTKSNEFNENFV